MSKTFGTKCLCYNFAMVIIIIQLFARIKTSSENDVMLSEKIVRVNNKYKLKFIIS